MPTNKNITLGQLQLALARVKAYDESKYSQLGHIHNTGEVTSLTGYVINGGGATTGQEMRIALSEGDTLNEALGKLDKSIFNVVSNIGSIDVSNHTHNDIYYKKTEIDDFIGELEDADADNLLEAKNYADIAVANLVDKAPEHLDTLKELADALANDGEFAVTMLDTLALKVAGPDTATVDHIAVFSQADGKAIKDSGFTIETSVPPGALFTDYKVQTAPNASAAIYFAGTTVAAGETNTLSVNNKFYIDGGQERIVAPNFEGHLFGKADTAGTADTALKTQAALTIKFNDTEAGVFDGSVAKEVIITPEAIGAPDLEYAAKASNSEVEDMLNGLFGAE